VGYASNEKKGIKMSKILLCEDDLIFAMSLKNFLEQRGYELHKITSSGEDLIYASLLYAPSLIIADITLKGELDGIEAMARIEEIKKIPFIYITGHSEYLSLINSYNLSPLRVFIKPIDMNELADTIDEVLHIHVPAESVSSNYYIG